MRYSNRTIGLFQAAGITLYVCLFAFAIQTISGFSFAQNIQLPPLLGISLFLLTFIVSALICGSIFLAYPIKLFFNNKRDIAYKIVSWSIFWLLIFFLAFLLIVFMAIAKF